MVALELQAQYAALVERQSNFGDGLRERLVLDLEAAREIVNGVNLAMERGEDLTALLEEGEGLVDRLEAQLYLLQEIGLEAFLQQRGSGRWVTTFWVSGPGKPAAAKDSRMIRLPSK